MTLSHTPIMYEMFLSRPSEKEWLERHLSPNVCRCIPNCEIVFLVIAISICAFLSLLSHFRLSLISAPLSSLSVSVAHAHMLRHTQSSAAPSPSALSLLPPIFHSPWLTLIRRSSMWVFKTFLSRSEKTGREERALPDYRTIWYSPLRGGRKYARMHKCCADARGRRALITASNAVPSGSLIDKNPAVFNKAPLPLSFSPWLSHVFAWRCASKLRHPLPAN